MPERKEDKPGSLYYFDFTCPTGRELEAIGALDEIEGITIFEEGELPSRREWIGDESSMVIEGSKIGGTTGSETIDEIVNTLSKRQIAGHSRETQIFFMNIEQIRHFRRDPKNK